MENKITYQKLRKGFEDKYTLAQKYYGILSVLNNLSLTEREIQLIAYTAIRGSVSFANVRKDFCERYDSSNATVNNIVSRMKKLGVMIKDEGKVKLNPIVALDFEKDVILQVILSNEKRENG